MRNTSIRTMIGLLFWIAVVGTTDGQSLIDTLFVTTMKAPMKINETGRNISVVTAEQIAELPVTSLDEILQTVAGMEIQSRGGFGVQADVTMRGATYTQVLILVNGMKINDPLTGHFNGYLPVTPAEIERIEILRGPASAIYGADAVGGVVNIITRTFAGRKQGASISGDFSFGDHKLVSGQMGFSYKKDRLALSGGMSINRSEGEYYEAEFVDSTTTLEAYRNYFDLRTIGAAVAYQLTPELNIRLHSAFDTRDFDARYFYTTSPFDKSTEVVENWWNHMQLIRTKGKSTTDFNLAYKYNTDEFIFSPDFPSTNYHVTQYINSTLNHLQQISNRVMVKGGIQLDHRQIESNDRGDHNDVHWGIYTMGVYQHQGWNVTAGLRGDYDDNYGFEFSPQINVSYILSDFVIRGSIGRSIRAADYTERYVSNNLQDLTPGRSLGNPDLLAERGWSEEIGLDYQVNRQWKVKGTVFFRQSTDLIDYILTNEAEIGSVSDVGSLQPGADYYFAQNIADVSTSGAEFEVNGVVSIGLQSKIDFNAGYTFLSTNTTKGISSVYLSSHARHQLTGSFGYQFKGFDISATGLYKYRDPMSAPEIGADLKKNYFVCHLRAGIELLKNLGCYVQIQNVFNARYQNILGARMPGRWIMGGVSWRLNVSDNP